MAAMGLTEVSATSQEIVTQLVQETLKQESLLIDKVMDLSQFAVPGSNQVQFPRRTQFAAADKTENTDLSKQEITFAVDTISLDKHKAIFAELERIAQVQAMVNVESEIIVEMAKELALQIDKDIITELQLASAAAPDHRILYANSPTNTLQDVDILEARRLLNVQIVPQEDRWMMINPDDEKAILQIANFIEQDKYGPNMAIAKGELGMVRGFRVLMHTSVPATTALLWHKSAVGYARQLAPEFKRDDNLANAAEQFLLHQIYGVEVLDGGKRNVEISATGA